MSRTSQTKRRIWTVAGGQMTRRRDVLATEEPLEIQLQAGREARTVAITMRTPGSDYELAAGFLYNEGVIPGKDAIATMTYCVDDGQQEYNTLAVRLRAARLPALPHLERHFFTHSGCGVCGTTMLEDLQGRAAPVAGDGVTVSAETLATLPTTLTSKQPLFSHTGGLHAAALFDTGGHLLAVREDVGRHNALDKLIGWGLLNDHLPFANRIILVSGRASFELLQKCAVAGAPIFCAVSAPSSLAVALAIEFNITLIGFLRRSRCNIYAYPNRIVI